MKKNLLLSVLFLILSLLLGSCLGIHEDVEEVLAPVESIEILVLESFPVQIHVVIEGYLPNPCHEITRIEKHREGNIFYVTVMMKESGFICIEVIEPYQEVVVLDVYGLSAGTYQVNVNGVLGSFTLDMDNILIDMEE